MNQKKERKPHNFKWDYEACRLEALKYNTRTEFSKNGKGAYVSALNNNFIDEICKHMEIIQLPSGYWTKEKCKEKASSCKTKSEFEKKYPSAYNKCLKNNWIPEVCFHMESHGNRYKRLVYIFLFNKTKSCYIGLTFNSKKRYKQHLKDKNSPVFKHFLLDKEYKYIEISDYIDLKDAQNLEAETIKFYKKNGFNVLNIAKAGSAGGNFIKWTKEKSKEEIIKYEFAIDFQNQNPSCYQACLRNKWLDVIGQHLIYKKHSNDFWTYEKCINESKKYNNRMDFKKHNYSAYFFSLKNNWLNYFYPYNSKLKWTYKKCEEEALKYNTRSEFQKNSSSAYISARKNNWLDKICKHMYSNKLPNGYWTYELCKQEALKYNTRNELAKNNCSAYHSALKNNWLDDIFKHTYKIIINKPKSYWSFDKCKLETLKYNTRSEFSKKNRGAYKAALKNGWLDEFFPKKKAS